MKWTVKFSTMAKKQKESLPKTIREILRILVKDIEEGGPVQGQWPNYSKLNKKKDRHHCHLKMGSNSYVAVWQVNDRQVKLIEVTYVGTREKAPY